MQWKIMIWMKMIGTVKMMSLLMKMMAGGLFRKQNCYWRHSESLQGTDVRKAKEENYMGKGMWF